MGGVSRLLIACALLASCSKKSEPTAKPAPANAAASTTGDPCARAVDKLFAFLTRKGYEPEAGVKEDSLAECRKKPDDPVIACLDAAADDAAIEQCMRPKPKGEPGDQLDQMAQSLRTYFFVHETFTDQNLPLLPAKPCCQFPTKKCPPETKADHWWTGVLALDLSTDRNFQYRFESTSHKAVIEAVGDVDCDGKTVTYRRELELRDDGNMHITVTDPPAGSD